MKKMTHMEDHWTKDSKQYQNVDAEGWSLVCYVGMPIWFNRFMDVFQRRAFYFLMNRVPKNPKKVLDIGTGVGRWVKHLQKYTKQSHITGIDIEPHRLDRARKKFPKAQFRKANIEKLPFHDETFDFVNSITVLQHMPYVAKGNAIKEISRVTKKGGYVLLIELIDMNDTASHVFPLKKQEWIKVFAQYGFEVKRTTGYEYIFILRLLRLVQGFIRGKRVITKSEGKVMMKSWEWGILRLCIWISYPIELIATWIFPLTWSRHAGLLLRKR